MNKKELSELKKRFKKENCTITRIAGCYVNAEKTIIGTFSETFLNLEEEVFYKYLEIFKKGLTGSVDKNIRTFDLPSGNPMRDFLLKLRDSKLKNEEMLMRFYEQIIENYDQSGNFAILLIHDCYDVIKKGTDQLRQDESEEVYEYLGCYICPVQLDKPGLAFDPETNTFVQKSRKWCLDCPTCSFIYPAFENRSADIDRISFTTKKADGTFDGMIENVFHILCKESPEEQRKNFLSLIEETVKDQPDIINTVKNIYEKISEKIESSDFSEPVLLEKEDIREILSESGVAITSDFDRNYDKKMSNEPIPATNIMNTNKLEVKTPDIVIKIKPQKLHLMKSEIINGRKSFVLSMNSDDTVEINGQTIL